MVGCMDSLTNLAPSLPMKMKPVAGATSAMKG